MLFITQVTDFGDAAQSRNPVAAAELLPLVYSELRWLAVQKLARESPDQSL